MPITRLALRTRARTLADQDDSDYPSNTQYDTWLEEAKREVWSDLVMAGWPVDYTTQAVAANGAASYPLASGAGVFGVRAVYRVDGDRRILVPRVDPQSKPTTGDTASGYEVTVSPTAGTVLRLYPATVSGSYSVEYLAEPVDFTDDTSTWGGPARSDTLICYQAAAKGCRKEGRRGDAADLLSDYAGLLEKVVASASWVDMRNPPMIRDVMGGGDPLRDPFDYPGSSADY